MDKLIEGVLACPLCRGSLRLDVKQRDEVGAREGSLLCVACDKTYPITEGVFDLRPGIRLREEDGSQRWDLDACEQGYESIGLYKSSQDWARIKGVPVNVIDFIHDFVKGQLLDWGSFGTRDIVLDAGCGVGHFLFDLRARQSDSEMVFIGMDVALPRVRALRKRCEEEGVANILCIAGDSENLPIAFECIDHIISSEVLEHVFHPEKAIGEMERVLKSSGHLLISTPSGNASRNWEYLIKPVRWTRNIVARPEKQEKTDAGYDVPLELDVLRKYLRGNRFEIKDFAIQPVLPCEHFFKQVPDGLARVIVPFFRIVNRYLPFLKGQLGLHAVVRSQKQTRISTAPASSD